MIKQINKTSKQNVPRLMGNKDRENKDSVCDGEEIEVENENIGK